MKEVSILPVGAFFWTNVTFFLKNLEISLGEGLYVCYKFSGLIICNPNEGVTVPEKISENLGRVREKIERAAKKAGRNSDEITLIGATKGVEAKRVKEAVKLGLRTFGENYVQEAMEKIGTLGREKVRWHFIGHLQKNKAKHAVELFRSVQSVDSVELAEALSKKTISLKIPPIEVLIEVNLGGEKTKAGVKVKGLTKLAKKVVALEGLNLRGLMAIPPNYDDPEMSRPYFVTLRRLAEQINREITGARLHELSMGMSHDFEIAIEEGATMVRVGTAIFGPREPKVTPKTTTKKAQKKS